MKNSIGVLAILGMLGTACKSHDLNTTDSSEVRSSATSLIGKTFSISCNQVDINKPVLKVVTTAPLNAENVDVKNGVPISADWLGSTEFKKLAGKLGAADTGKGTWLITVKSVAPSFYPGEFKGEFNLDSLTSVKGEWWDPARTENESHKVNCKLQIGTGAIQEGVAPEAARYKCQRQRRDC